MARVLVIDDEQSYRLHLTRQLEKPFSLEALSQRVRTILAAGDAAGGAPADDGEEVAR